LVVGRQSFSQLEKENDFASEPPKFVAHQIGKPRLSRNWKGKFIALGGEKGYGVEKKKSSRKRGKAMPKDFGFKRGPVTSEGEGKKKKENAGLTTSEGDLRLPDFLKTRKRKDKKNPSEGGFEKRRNYLEKKGSWTGKSVWGGGGGWFP